MDDIQIPQPVSQDLNVPQAPMQPYPAQAPSTNLSPQGQVPGAMPPGGLPQMTNLGQPQQHMQSSPQQSMQGDFAQQVSNIPPEANDVDVIEKEWVNHLKDIAVRTASSPYAQQSEISRAKADYMKKRYNKDIKVSEG